MLKIENKNIIGLTLFWLTAIFQLTELKFIWGIESISRFSNIFLLLFFLVIAFVSVVKNKLSLRVWFIVGPSFLVCVAMLFNIGKNVLFNPNLASYFGLVLPWAALSASIFLVRMKILDPILLWRHFYYFMLFSIIFSLIEYCFVFLNIYPLRQLITPNGKFLTGKFTLFHMLEDETPHFRFYSSFAEPGTLSMYLLPAIIYSVYFKKYFSIIIFAIAFFFTYSLGGYISLIIMLIVFGFSVLGFRRIKLFILISGILSILFSLLIYNNLKDEYEQKGESAGVREKSFVSIFSNFSTIVYENPLGYELQEKTSDYEKENNNLGSNFTPAYAYMLGGVVAFLGYIIVILVSLSSSILFIMKSAGFVSYSFRHVASISIIVLFPYIFQRMTIWDSTIFALLFFPVMLKYWELPASISGREK
jgi:hypothetical protein